MISFIYMPIKEVGLGKQIVWFWFHALRNFGSFGRSKNIFFCFYFLNNEFQIIQFLLANFY